MSSSYVTEKARPPSCSWKRLSTIAGHSPSPSLTPIPLHHHRPMRPIQVCRPIKFVSMWARQLMKKYADVVTDDRPLQKSLERTQDALIHKDALRAKIVECMNLKKSIADEIVECKVLVASLASARAAHVARANAARADAEKAAKASLAPPQGQLDDEDGLDFANGESVEAD